MTIEPDTKDWTWVIEQACPECGFDAAAVDVEDIPDLLRANAAAWPAVLARPDVRDRPDPSTWSPLEYACHVRDACQVFGDRLALMLQVDDPLFANWDQDATAEQSGYGEQDPERVTGELQRQPPRWPPGSERSTGRNGSGPAGAPTERCSPSRHSPGTSCTIRRTTCTTSAGHPQPADPSRDGAAHNSLSPHFVPANDSGVATSSSALCSASMPSTTSTSPPTIMMAAASR